MLRAGFMGSPEFAVPSLRAAARVCDLRVAVCQPDRPAGRGRKLTAPPVKVAATELGIPVIQPTKMKDGTLAAALAEHELDVILVVAFGRILPKAILDLPPLGCINVHGSVLPRWRGAAPIQRAVLAGDPETGVSIMAMDEGLDTGPVYVTASTPIGPRETSGELFGRLATLGAETLEVFLGAFPNVAAPKDQDDGHATHAPPLTKEEGRVDWNRPASTVANHVRGMDPWPGAFTMRGDDRLKLFGAEADGPAVAERDATLRTPGTVLGLDGDRLRIACLGGTILVDELQPPGKRRMPASAYAAGRPFAEDERLG